MISLSDDELRSVMQAAAPIDPRDRGAFLRDVASELAKYSELGPGVVGRVVANLQRKYFDPPNFQNGGRIRHPKI
jgi:hypothetical protein